MSLNFSAWSIRRPLPAILVFILLVAAGLISFRGLAISQFPDVTLPTVLVTVAQPGAAPTTLETQVTRRVEDAVASVAGIDELRSTVSEGVSITRVAFTVDRDAQVALQEVRDAVDGIRSDLPAGIEEPIVAKENVAGGDIITFAVASDRLSQAELSWLVDDTVSKRLYGIPGVGAVRRIGGVTREVRIDLDPQALQAYGVSAASLSQQLARLQVEEPGGRTTLGRAEQAVRTDATVTGAQDLRNFPLLLPDGRTVRLGTIATVTDSYADRTQSAWLNGDPVVGFAVQRTLESSEVDVGDSVRAAVAQISEANPSLAFEEVASTTPLAKASYDASMVMLLEGGFLAVVVVWFFLRDWRATFISAIALPLSIIPTFAVMAYMGFSLNLLTLLAMAVVVGILVDDAIVEVENIDRHLRMGKPPVQAATEAADEIGLAVIATSFTLAAVFIPVAFMPGTPGKFFLEFGWTAAAAVLFSLLVARLITPMMAAYMLKPMPHSEEDSRLMKWYMRLVERAITQRRRTVLLAAGLFFGSLALVPLLPTTFIPPSDAPQSLVQLELSPGTSLETTEDAAEQARQLIADIPEIKHVFVTAGAGAGTQGGPGAGAQVDEVRKASLTLLWHDDRGRSQQELEAEVSRRLVNLPGVRFSFQGNEPGRNLQLVLAGDDADALVEAARAAERAIRQLPGLGTVQSTASLVRPEIVIRPIPEQATAVGLTTSDIAAAARVATRGDYEQFLPKLTLENRQVPIRIRLEGAALENPDLLAQLRIPTPSGAAVPMGTVADIVQTSGPSQIDRFDRQRNVTITINLNGLPLGQVDAAIRALPEISNLPPGVFLRPSGDTRVFAEMFLGFVLAMGTGLFCVYAVLLLLFNHASQPITILVAVPLAAAGAIGALLVTGTEISLPVMIGLIMLIGIAVKNSILIVDYVVIAQRDLGMNRHDALLDACHKRARPVLMTTLAMGAGMLPIAIGISADASFRAPMAISVIGGLISSTVLSLVVVPAAYTYVDDVDQWLSSGTFRRLFSRRRNERPESRAATPERSTR